MRQPSVCSLPCPVSLFLIPLRPRCTPPSAELVVIDVSALPIEGLIGWIYSYCVGFAPCIHPDITLTGNPPEKLRT